MKKILIINTVYSGGGAAKVANQVFECINKDNYFDVYFAYGKGYRSNQKNVFKFGFTLENILHTFFVRFLGIEGFGTYFSTRKFIKFIKKGNFDLIHIHNLHGYYLNFFTLFDFLNKSKIPIIWTFHDEWPITWMPAHSMGCKHCKTMEGKCTNQYNYPKTYNKFFSIYMLNKKREYFSKNLQLTIICPSNWIKNEVENSYLGECNIELIHNGVDIDIYKPLDNKIRLREKYKIPLNKKIILFSIPNIKDVNKGYNFIQEITKKFKNKDVYFVGVGSCDIKNDENVKVFDYILDEKLMAEIYNLADIFLYTSLIETLSLTVAESMACGLPVVAFDIPGVNELVDKDCGFLSKPRDVLELLNNINYLLNNNQIIENMSIKSRQKIVNYLSQEKTLFGYKDSYNNILNI